MSSSSRRAFLTGALPFAAALAGLRSAQAADPVDGEEAHPIDPPKAFDFKVMSWPSTPFYGGPSTAIAAIPRVLPPSGQLPLVILLPGGHHNMQRHDKGAWGWWSEYQLGDIDAALRRGTLDEKDFRKLVRPRELEEANRLLAATPYRGAVYVTPWVVGRQLEPAPHGTMVATFLRDLVARCRRELPVIATRESTGLGGMSSGGLWTLYSGSLCSDLFGTLVATQPFTEDLVKPLRAAINARETPQRLRMVTSDYDHQRETTLGLSDALTSDGITHELADYLGPHSAGFAAGPGGIDALLTFDRALRGEAADGTRPLPPHDGLSSTLSEGLVHDDLPRRVRAPSSGAAASGPLSTKWPLAAIGVVAASAAVALRRGGGQS